MLEFASAKPIEVPVKIEGKDYILRERSAAVGIEWRDAMTEGRKVEQTFDKEGKVTKVEADMSRTGKADMVQLSQSLYFVNGDGGASEKPVGQAHIIGWKDSLIQELLKELNRISSPTEEQSKNSPAAGAES
jgi:hypothetical protein